MRLAWTVTGCGGAAGFAEERGLAVVQFDEVERQARCDRQHQTGEAGTAAEVDATRHARRDQGDQLQAIVDVALTQHGRITGGDQVDGRIPAQQQDGEDVEPRLQVALHVKHSAPCFT